MTEVFSEMSRAKRSLETVKNSKKLLPSFFSIDKKKEDIVWCMHAAPTELLVAFDLKPMWPENFGTLCAARLVAPKFIGIAESEGFSTDLCSYLTNSMGYCKSSLELGEVPPESPIEGGMGEPIMLLGSAYLCEPRYKWFQAIGTRYLDVPVFNTDPIPPAYDIDVDDPRVAAHYMDPLREEIKTFVAFLEKHTSKKLDMDQFRE